MAFSRIGEVRSIMSSTVKVMALTATATGTLRKQVERLLGMDNPVCIARSPDKTNIIYINIEVKGSINNILEHILQEITTKRTLLPRIIIFCKTKTDCPRIYTFFQVKMGLNFTEPPGVSQRIPQCRLVDMFFKGTADDVKNAIVSNFTNESSLRIVISTVAFGMGINCPDVHLIIHFGCPEDVEMYVQEVGRAGRDNSESFAVLLHSPKLLRNCSDQMKEYVRNTTTCRRNKLFADFENYSHSEVNDGCKCCDICMKKCKCGKCLDNMSQQYSFIRHLINS